MMRRPAARVGWLAVLLAAGCGRAAPAEEAAPVVRAWPVMGTMLEVTVWEADSAVARRGLAAARAAVERVDSLMSVYKPESDLSRVNRAAGRDTGVVVSPETAEVLAEAIRYGERTGGALDVTVGPLVDAWGFYRHEGRVPPRAVLDSARALVGFRRIEFDRESRSVRLPEWGMRLDFGGIAKGDAVDRAVAALREAGVERALVNLGGNIRVLGRGPDEGMWRLGVRDPRAPEEVLAVVRVEGGAIATSGDYEQFFVHEGIRYSHIFDPRTGWPSRGVAGATVLAPTGLASDALSTALFVLGPGEGCRVAAAEPGVEAVWVLDPGPSGELEPEHIVHTPGLAGRLELFLPEGAAGRPVPCGVGADGG